MSDRDYYPAGAYNDTNAPYNKKEQDPVAFERRVDIVLTKYMDIETADYTSDEDGYDTGQVNWHEEYRDSHIPFTDMLDELAKYIEGELAGGCTIERRRHLRDMLSECRGWSTESIDISEP